MFTRVSDILFKLFQYFLLGLFPLDPPPPPLFCFFSTASPVVSMLAELETWNNIQQTESQKLQHLYLSRHSWRLRQS